MLKREDGEKGAELKKGVELKIKGVQIRKNMTITEREKQNNHF